MKQKVTDLLNIPVCSKEAARGGSRGGSWDSRDCADGVDSWDGWNGGDSGDGEDGKSGEGGGDGLILTTKFLSENLLIYT